jgi:hypothetical protein
VEHVLPSLTRAEILASKPFLPRAGATPESLIEAIVQGNRHLVTKLISGRSSSNVPEGAKAVTGGASAKQVDLATMNGDELERWYRANKR